ncbi:MAG: hypothetical protein GY903_22395 [Fuerstiella sp.]|nr:hypothetical protein [Fuerstiella sp.]MCP4857243.1 hypothetical protein [Fuerstiella sp.]
MTEVTKPDPQSSSAETHPEETGSSGVRVAVLLVLVGVSAWGCYVWVTGENGFDIRRFAMVGERQIDVYAVDGEVFFNDEPVSVGHVAAIPVNGRNGLTRVIGPITDGGTFEFYTEVDGKLIKGVPTGEYKLLLKVSHPSPGLGQPSPMLPPEYYDPATTPLSMTVSADQDKHHVVIKEQGELLPDVAGQNARTRSNEEQQTDKAAETEE